MSKNTETTNLYDEQMEKLKNELALISLDLRCSLKEVNIKLKMLQFFIENTLVWEKTKNDILEAKKSLHSVIEQYDSKYNEIKNYMQLHEEAFDLPWIVPSTSQEVIEIFLKVQEL